jgi:hypothetical protein
MSGAVNTHKLTILTQDPGVRIRRRLAVSQVDLPAEAFDLGPTGYRVKVIDFDAGSNVLYKGREYEVDDKGAAIDPYAPPDPTKTRARAWRKYESRLLEDPRFHAQNVYAIAMRTLALFERALGRRVEWGFRGHQLHIAPHAFVDANAFYSELDHALMFGYFEGRTGATVFTSLSHDIVAHETTHALLDGLRDSFSDESIPDQAAFHEGFADVVALLSVFSLPETTKACLIGDSRRATTRQGLELISNADVSREALKRSLLFGLGKQFGAELRELRGDVLRRSVELDPADARIDSRSWEEPHLRGEVFSAAMLNAFLDLWVRRIEELGTLRRGYRSLGAVVEEGSKLATHLLTVAIRALDYCPAVDLSFSAYLSSLLTADTEVSPDDSRFDYRGTLRRSFRRYGITPPRGRVVDSVSGCWKAWEGELIYSRAHFESMLRDKEEVFRFLWENRGVLGIDGRGFTRVNFVRPAVRFGPDGLILRETIAEWVQEARIFGSEVDAILGCARPKGMSTRQSITAYGGGTLVFDQYGRLKYHIHHPLLDPERQGERLAYLWRTGAFEHRRDARARFSQLHRQRATS